MSSQATWTTLVTQKAFLHIFLCLCCFFSRLFREQTNRGNVSSIVRQTLAYTWNGTPPKMPHHNTKIGSVLTYNHNVINFKCFLWIDVFFLLECCSSGYSKWWRSIARAINPIKRPNNQSKQMEKNELFWITIKKIKKKVHTAHKKSPTANIFIAIPVHSSTFHYHFSI